MNDPDVRRHLPLAQGCFGRPEYESFVADKERVWAECGYGPWAFVLDGEFIGWGGLQPEAGDVGLALVLRKQHWGAGKALCERLINHAFGELGVQSVVALLPPSRTRVIGLKRLRFGQETDVTMQGVRFRRFRLDRPVWESMRVFGT